MRKIIILLSFTCAFSLRAQSPWLVKDINTTVSFDVRSSTPSDFLPVGAKTFFLATSEVSGREPWISDGTAAGTSQLADIVPGTAGSDAYSIGVVNGLAMFAAREVNQGIELWASDGTAAGTRRVADLNPGPNSSQPTGGLVFRGRMLLTMDDGTNGRELWSTDGTSSGTRLVKDINPGSGSSSPATFTEMGGVVYFNAAGLWKTDGTEGGTVKVASVSARHMVVAGSQLFFEGTTTPNSNWELWVSDGTEAGTRRVADIFPGGQSALDNFSGFVALGNRVVFFATDGSHGKELWTSDGTEAGTRLVRDFIPGSAGAFDNRYPAMVVFGQRAIFSAPDTEHGFELWSTDGTDAGTALLLDIEPGSASSSPAAYEVSGNKLYIVCTGGITLRLWVTDGTRAGLQLLSDVVGIGKVVGDRYFFAGSAALTGTEPWVTDGTVAGTHIIANLWADVQPSSNPRLLAGTNKLLFFHATEGTRAPGTNAIEASLWRSDGTPEGTFKLLETGQHPPTLLPVGSFVFFKFPNDNATETMVSDGTPEGTGSSAGFLRRFGGATLFAMYPFGDTLLAKAGDSFDTALWITRGELDAPATNLGSKGPFGVIEYAGRYMWMAEGVRGIYSYSLWTSDGTLAGTYPFYPDLGDTPSYGALANPLANVNGTVFFLREDNQTRITKLWKTDGTFDGTVAIKEVPGVGAYITTHAAAAGRRFFFVTYDKALWVSDGTEAGTVEVAKVGFNVNDLNEGNRLKSVGRFVVFPEKKTDNTYELWVSDGTKDGTRVLQTRIKLALTPIEGLVYFTGWDELHGYEPWVTDGTPEGTHLVADVNPGPASSNAEELTKSGNVLYVAADHLASGRELWAIPLTEQTLTIRDARVVEGDANARFTLSLRTPATQPVTVQYATADGTAKAGEDYDAATGTVTFGAGEMLKNVDVHVRSDAAYERNEIFYLTLRNATNAHLVRDEAFASIEDNDVTADLSIAPAFAENGVGHIAELKVANAGPASATGIDVKITSAPALSIPGFNCTCSIAQLPSGGSAFAGGGSVSSDRQTYMSAIATAKQTDPNPSNNAVAWTENWSIVVNAVQLSPGDTATAWARLAVGSTTLWNSDPTVLSMPSNATALNSELGTFTIRALKTGTAIIRGPMNVPLTLSVVEPGTSARWPEAITINTSNAIRIDQPLAITISAPATAPISGASPTGTVTVVSAGKELARHVISGPSQATLKLYLAALGSMPFQVLYSGDANFQPQSFDKSVQVYQGFTTISGVMRADATIAGSFTLDVQVAGSPAAPPSGAVAILNGSTEIARGTLVASNGTSKAQLALKNLSSMPTLTIRYLGDALYNSGSQQVRYVPHRRSAHH